MNRRRKRLYAMHGVTEQEARRAEGYSESRAWREVRQLTDAIEKAFRRVNEILDNRRGGPAFSMSEYQNIVHVHDGLERLKRLADMMARQLERGVHKNPPLVLVTNPPSDRHKFVGMRITLVGQLSQDVHSVAYTHIDDGVDYRHDFERRTDLLAGETPSGQRVLVLLNPDGMAVWDRFD